MSGTASDHSLDTRAQSVAGFPEGAEGVTPPTNTSGAGGFLSDVILDLGFADGETVERAIEAARQPGRRVDQILLETGAVTEEELARALAERYGLDHVDLDRFEVDMSAARLISRSAALRYRAVPIAFAADRTLIVAVADPVDALAIDDIEVMTKTEARQAVASEAAIDALAEQLPEVGMRPQSRNGHQTLDPSSPPPEPTEPVPPVHQEPEQEADFVTVEPEARNAAIEAELAEANEALRELGDAHDALRELATAHDALREQTNETEAERDGLRERVIAATQERDSLREAVEQLSGDRDRLSEALDQVTQERDELSTETERRSADFASLLERATAAERLADEARDRIQELEDSDRRAEAARLALSEQRKESEREREQSGRLEQKLREELTAAEQRHAALERHLSGFITAAAEAKSMAEELLAADATITNDDTPSESDGTPPERSTEPESPGPAGELRNDDPPPSSIQKPTI